MSDLISGYDGERRDILKYVVAPFLPRAMHWQFAQISKETVQCLVESELARFKGVAETYFNSLNGRTVYGTLLLRSECNRLVENGKEGTLTNIVEGILRTLCASAPVLWDRSGVRPFPRSMAHSCLRHEEIVQYLPQDISPQIGLFIVKQLFYIDRSAVNVDYHSWFSEFANKFMALADLGANTVHKRAKIFIASPKQMGCRRSVHEINNFFTDNPRTRLILDFSDEDTLPQTYLPEAVKKLSIYGPTVKTLRKGAFWNANSIEEIDLSNLKELQVIQDFCLAHLSQLAHLNMTGLGKLERIGSSFLWKCKKLISINTYGVNAVKSIGTGFGYECISLNKLDLSELPDLWDIGHGFLAMPSRHPAVSSGSTLPPLTRVMISATTDIPTTLGKVLAQKLRVRNDDLNLDSCFVIVKKGMNKCQDGITPPLSRQATPKPAPF